MIRTNKVKINEVNSKVSTETFDAHKADASVHITEEERNRWNTAPHLDESGNMTLAATEQGRPSREVAAELGICIDTLRSWLKAAGAPSAGQADRQNRDARRLRELEAEIRARRKKLEEKDGVIDILKKSVGILSKP